MREITLTNGMITLVDDEDYLILAQKKWHAKKIRYIWYAIAYSRKNTIFMHRLISDAPKGSIVDHINGNGLDNRRKNLRIVSHAINRLSAKMSQNNTSGYRGVVLEKRTGRWVAHTQITEGKKKEMSLYRHFRNPRGSAYCLCSLYKRPVW